MIDGNMLGDLILWLLAFIFSTTFHEAAHAFFAYKGGDETAYLGGQVSMNPLPHIAREPVGMVLVPLISFFIYQGGFLIGWASTPYDPHWAARHPKRAGLMALAGPMSNLSLVIVFAIAIRVGLEAGVFAVQEAGIIAVSGEAGSVWEPVATLCSIMFFLNLLLCVFNLLPVPPLDGHEAILLFVPEHKAPQVRDFMARIGFFGIIIAWLVIGRVFWPIYSVALALLLL